MPEPAHEAGEHYPVRWLNRHALVTLPERVGESNARPMREQLLSVVDDDVLVLILDMTATTACDHAGGVALAQVYQRAVASGTELRPVVVDEGVRRVLTVSGVGRLVPVYDTVAAALAATRPDHNIAAAASGVPGRPGGRTESQRPGPAPRAAEDPDTEVALLDRDGVIVSVNDAWRAPRRGYGHAVPDPGADAGPAAGRAAGGGRGHRACRGHRPRRRADRTPDRRSPAPGGERGSGGREHGGPAAPGAR